MLRLEENWNELGVASRHLDLTVNNANIEASRQPCNDVYYPWWQLNTLALQICEDTSVRHKP